MQSSIIRAPWGPTFQPNVDITLNIESNVTSYSAIISVAIDETPMGVIKNDNIWRWVQRYIAPVRSRTARNVAKRSTGRRQALRKQWPAWVGFSGHASTSTSHNTRLPYMLSTTSLQLIKIYNLTKKTGENILYNHYCGGLSLDCRTLTFWKDGRVPITNWRFLNIDSFPM